MNFSILIKIKMKTLKTFLMALVAIAFCAELNAQTIWTEDFDGSNTTNAPTLTGECTDETGDYFGIVGSADINITYGGAIGNFLSAQDTDDIVADAVSGCMAGSVAVSADFTDIDVSSCGAELYLCFDIADAPASNGANDWDASSSIVVSVDGASVANFAGTETNSVGVANGDATSTCTVGGTFTTYCSMVTIPADGTADINIAINGMDAADEDVAVDNITFICGVANLPAANTDFADCEPSVCDLMLVEGTATCDANTTGTDTYTAIFTFTDTDGLGTYTVTASNGTPDMATVVDMASGTITVTGATEGIDVVLTITDGTDCNLMVTVMTPTCTDACPDITDSTLSATVGGMAATDICSGDAVTVCIDVDLTNDPTAIVEFSNDGGATWVDGTPDMLVPPVTTHTVTVNTSGTPYNISPGPYYIGDVVSYEGNNVHPITITAPSGGALVSGATSNGTFTAAAGTYNFQCDVHTPMSGSITFVERPQATEFCVDFIEMNTDCNPAIVSYQAQFNVATLTDVTCDLDNQTMDAAGAVVSVNVYPIPTAPMITIDDAVCNYTIMPACPNDVLTPDTFGPAAPGDDPAAFDVMVSNAGNCMATFSVDPPVCPTTACDLTLVAGTPTCDAVTTDPDTYTATFTFTDTDGMGTYTVTASAGTPDMTTITNMMSGTVTVTGITEGTNVTLTITDGADCNEMVTITSPVCEPVVVCEISNIVFTQACTGADDMYELCVSFDYENIGASGQFNVYLDPAGTGTPTTIVAGPFNYTDYQTAIDGGAACFTVTGYTGDAADLEAGLEVCIGDADAPAPGTGLPPGTIPMGGIPSFACPQVYGILHNACAPPGGEEGPNEFVVIVNGAAPTDVSSIVVDTPSGSDYDDFNATAAPASWICPCCVYLDETGTIPAGGVVVATSAANTSTLDFTSLCGTAGTIYVLQDDGVGSTGHFSNSNPRSTVLNLSGTTSCDGATSYTYTNSDGADGDYTTFAGPDNPGVTTAGSTLGTPDAGNTNSSGDCTPQIAPASEVECFACGTLDEVACAAACPVVDTPLATTEDLCDGGMPALDATTLILDDATLATQDANGVVVTWYTDAALTTTFNGTVAHSGADNCVTEDVILYAAIECIATPAPLIAAGQTTITVYPSYDVTLVDMVTSADCTVPTVASSCGDYTITPDPANPAAPASGMMATFNYTIEYNNGPNATSCFTETFSVMVNCPAPNCPVVTTPLATTEDVCDGGMPALDDTALMVDDETLATPAGAGITVSWWTDAALTTAFGGTVDYAMAGGDGCNTVDVTLYASIECAADNTVSAAGETVITIYPPYDATTLTITNADCTVATVVSSCANYTITPDPANPAAPAPGMMATFNFTIEYNGGPAGVSCFSQVEMVNVNCPAAGCPSVAPVDATDAVCDGALAGEIATWQGSVEADATNMAAIADGNTDAAVIYSTDAPAGVSEATPPTAGTATGVHSGADLCAAETQMTFAYLLCFGDDGVAGGGDDSYLALGMNTLTVYPTVQPTAEATDAMACTTTLTPGCASDTFGAGTNATGGAVAANWDAAMGVYTAAPGEAAGTLDVMVSSDIAGSTCPPIMVTITTTGCAATPGCTLVLSPETVTCDAETAGTDTYTVSIPFDNGTEGFPGGMNYTITTSGTLGGDNPMVVQSGTITITFTEGSPYDYSIQGTMGNPNELCDFMISGVSPTCEPVVCQDEIAGMVIGDPSCNLSGITVTITDDMGNVVTTLTTNSMGVYDSSPAVYPCGNYFAELTAGIPVCYGDGETAPKSFIIDGDDDNTDTDGPNFGTIANIPTVGEWGLIMLALLMSIVAVAGIKQRNIMIVKE